MFDINENIANAPTDCTTSMSGTATQFTQAGIYIFHYLQYNQDGSVYTVNGDPVLNNSPYISPECCKNLGGSPFLYNQIANGGIVNTGYLCCYPGGDCSCKISCGWTVSLVPVLLPPRTITYNGPQNSYLVFSDGGGPRVTSPDGCNCIGNPYTVSVPNVLDPYTGEIGTACQLTDAGIFDLTVLGTAGNIYQTYLQRSNGTIGCYDVISSNFS